MWVAGRRSLRWGWVGAQVQVGGGGQGPAPPWPGRPRPWPHVPSGLEDERDWAHMSWPMESYTHEPMCPLALYTEVPWELYLGSYGPCASLRLVLVRYDVLQCVVLQRSMHLVWT